MEKSRTLASAATLAYLAMTATSVLAGPAERVVRKTTPISPKALVISMVGVMVMLGLFYLINRITSRQK